MAVPTHCAKTLLPFPDLNISYLRTSRVFLLILKWFSQLLRYLVKSTLPSKTPLRIHFYFSLIGSKMPYVFQSEAHSYPSKYQNMYFNNCINFVSGVQLNHSRNPQKRRQIGSCLGTGEVTRAVIVGRMDTDRSYLLHTRDRGVGTSSSTSIAAA